jgi:hypothetical protein
VKGGSGNEVEGEYFGEGNGNILDMRICKCMEEIIGRYLLRVSILSHLLSSMWQKVMRAKPFEVICLICSAVLMLSSNSEFFFLAPGASLVGLAFVAAAVLAASMDRTIDSITLIAAVHSFVSGLIAVFRRDMKTPSCCIVSAQSRKSETYRAAQSAAGGSSSRL